jgi:hypothetical protein
MAFPSARRTGTRSSGVPPVSYCPPPDSESVVDWQSLEIGDQVVILDVSGQPIVGRIDDLCASASVLWVQQNDNRGRRMFSRTETRPLWRIPPPIRQGRKRITKHSALAPREPTLHERR